MGRQIKAIYKKAESSFNNPEHQKKWQGGIGILVMVVFVLSSVLFNKTVQAVNQSGYGYYGYSSGTYGYAGTMNTLTTSDSLPSAPTAFTATTPTAGSLTTATATLSWTAPTTTTSGSLIATGSGSISTYYVYYSTSSLSSCTGTTYTSSTSASASLTGLNSSTVYYVAICAEDNNGNDSSALTSSFTTAAVSGSGSVNSGSGSAASIGVTPKATTTVVPNQLASVPGTGEVTPLASTVATNADQLVAFLTANGLKAKLDIAAEAKNANLVTADLKEYKVVLSGQVKTIASNFITYGTSAATVKLGSGERRALLRDILDVLGDKANNADALLQLVEELTNGKKPSVRNLSKEQKQVPVLLKLFQQLSGKAKPDFKNAKDDLAWNTLQYRTRFSRDLNAEKVGIAQFKKVISRTPRTPIDWAAVRAYGYALAK